ncbi:FAD dependent oxidoreductase [Ascosphaera apis ARSEF 7405]|uniref:FAD dependent oxidoreductase n=1 Tax=Ascosphaera apis ARSEF 7405 TaxID=392613 RepID=A0A168DSS2_9EURO|nr:FAD dependent oxidoreductase [Ascosphaera apis ARSEF 7405]
MAPFTSSGPFPVANGTLSFWQTDPDRLANYRSTELLPEESDVLIIGSGISGTSVAYHFLKDNPNPPSITILEARQACSGATGRNGGHMRPTPVMSIVEHYHEHGLEAALEIANFEADHLSAIHDVVRDENIDCDFTITRSFDTFLDEQTAKEMSDEYNSLISKGVKFRQDTQHSFKDAERITGIKGAKGCFHFTAAHLWPYKFVLHLLNLVVSKGVNLQTNTPVVTIDEHPDKHGRWHVHTKDRGVIKAKKVIFATNAYTPGVAPQYQRQIVPIRGYVTRIVAPDGKPAPYFPITTTLQWRAWEFDYVIARPDGSIIVGGGKKAHAADFNCWYDNVNDNDSMEYTRAYFEKYMQRHFIGWEDSEAQLDRAWTGIMGFSADGLPHIGEVPGKADQYILAGFNGHGMPVCFLAARGIAQMVRDKLSFEQTGLPRLYKTTQSRLDNAKNVILEEFNKYAAAKL